MKPFDRILAAASLAACAALAFLVGYVEAQDVPPLFDPLQQGQLCDDAGSTLANLTVEGSSLVQGNLSTDPAHPTPVGTTSVEVTADWTVLTTAGTASAQYYGVCKVWLLPGGSNPNPDAVCYGYGRRTLTPRCNTPTTIDVDYTMPRLPGQGYAYAVECHLWRADPSGVITEIGAPGVVAYFQVPPGGAWANNNGRLASGAGFHNWDPGVTPGPYGDVWEGAAFSYTNPATNPANCVQVVSCAYPTIVPPLGTGVYYPDWFAVMSSIPGATAGATLEIASDCPLPANWQATWHAVSWTQASGGDADVDVIPAAGNLRGGTFTYQSTMQGP